MKKYIAFLFWIPKFFAAKVASAYSEYTSMLRAEPVLGLLLMFLLTILTFVVIAVSALAIFGRSTLAAIIGISPLVGIPLHYVVVQIQRLYSIFDKERQATFNALK